MPSGLTSVDITLSDQVIEFLSCMCFFIFRLADFLQQETRLFVCVYRVFSCSMMLHAKVARKSILITDLSQALSEKYVVFLRLLDTMVTFQHHAQIAAFVFFRLQDAFHLFFLFFFLSAHLAFGEFQPIVVTAAHSSTFIPAASAWSLMHSLIFFSAVMIATL